MKNSIWIVFLVLSGLLGFLLGYSVSAYTGTEQGGGYSTESAGYGEDESGESPDKTDTEPALDSDTGSAPDNKADDYFQNLYEESQQ